ncbi:MAG: 4-hydroxy-tetrahydrodipicolinate synthase [Nitriliruptoraceae bacterium]
MSEASPATDVVATAGVGRVVCAMATPFDLAGALDLAAAARLAQHLVRSGVDTVLVNGTTGESPTLRGDEPWRLLDTVLEAVGNDVSVMMGTGTNNTATTVEATAKATERGAASVLVVTPYYNRPEQLGLERHFRAAADATNLPVVLYDIPFRSGREIATETLIELAQVTNIVGVKDATADLGKVADVIAATRTAPGGFGVWCGADEANLPILAVGGSGVISVSAHLVAHEITEMVAIFNDDPIRARELHLRCMPLHRALFAEPSPAPLKAALKELGLIEGGLRLPLIDASDDARHRVMAVYEQIVASR